MLDNITWCIKNREVKFIDPNINVSRSFMEHAVNTIIKSEKLYKNRDYLWSSVMAYYAEYYAITSFLYAIGVKSENHFCSISLFMYLMNTKINLMRHKEIRVDAQYYLKTPDTHRLAKMMKEVKEIINLVNSVLSELNEEKIEEYRNKIKKIKMEK